MDFFILETLCYKTKLGSRLSRSLSHFEKDKLMEDIQQAIYFYNEQQSIIESFSTSYRIKSMQSVRVKYNRYDPTIAVDRVYNDLLGFRITCDNYDTLDLSSKLIRRISDMCDGKKTDDGYRGVHVYVQPTHEYYPIEIQFNTYSDRLFADWTHIYLYKQESADVGKHLRDMYDKGAINSEDDFREELKNVLSNRN